MAGSMSPAGGAEYITHHLVHWTMSFGGYTLHADTILVSLALMLGAMLLMQIAVWRLKVASPSRLQLVVEMLVEFVRYQMHGVGIGKHVEKTVGSLALTVFVWVLLMNAMDLVPVDLLPVVFMYAGVPYFRAVPTADMNMTFALAGAVLFFSEAVLFHRVGFFRGCYTILSHPFGIYAAPFNLLKHVIGAFSRLISLSLRLFGNLYGGELIFILIAGLVPYWIQGPPYWAWLALHLLIVTLQAFIFMVLSIIYISMSDHAADNH